VQIFLIGDSYAKRSNREPEDGSPNKKTETMEMHDDTGQDESLPSSSEEEEYGDDPVLKTFDVFVSNQLKDNIYLLQYPIRNPDEQYFDDSAPLLARLKQNEGAMELDVPIDTQNYNASRGEKFASAHMDPNVKSENKVLNQQRLSGKAQSNQANYFVAVVRGGILLALCEYAHVAGEMHLSPVKAAIQLRPDFHYFDTALGGDKRRKGHAEDAPAKQPRAVQVTLQFTAF